MSRNTLRCTLLLSPCKGLSALRVRFGVRFGVCRALYGVLYFCHPERACPLYGRVSVCASVHVAEHATVYATFVTLKGPVRSTVYATFLILLGSVYATAGVAVYATVYATFL